MMRHVGLYDQPTLALTTRLTAEVHRFVIAVIVQQPQAGQSFQILHGLSRRKVQRQKGGIGRDDDLFLQAALQSELRYAKGLILIGLVEVQISKGRLRDPPRHTTLAAVGNVDRHRFPRRFIQERVLLGALENQRHQIFEQGPGPAEQHSAPTDCTVGSTHREPMLNRDIAPSDGDETPKPRLTRQEIVVGAIQAAFGNVVAD